MLNSGGPLWCYANLLVCIWCGSEYHAVWFSLEILYQVMQTNVKRAFQMNCIIHKQETQRQHHRLQA